MSNKFAHFTNNVIKKRIIPDSLPQNGCLRDRFSIPYYVLETSSGSDENFITIKCTNRPQRNPGKASSIISDKPRLRHVTATIKPVSILTIIAFEVVWIFEITINIPRPSEAPRTATVERIKLKTVDDTLSPHFSPHQILGGLYC